MLVLRLFHYHNYKVEFGMRNLATVLSLLFIGISVSMVKSVNIYIDRKRVIVMLRKASLKKWIIICVILYLYSLTKNYRQHKELI